MLDTTHTASPNAYITDPDPTLTEIAAEIVCAFVTKNSLPVADLPALLSSVYATLAGLGRPVATVPAAALVPAVPVKRSVTDEFIVCLEDGKRFKSLRRHLMASYGLTPEQYRAKWGLPADYSMVAPDYAKARSALAKDMGLGQQRRKR